jgi:hypothetical protein
LAQLNPTLQPHSNTSSRHKPTFLWLQLIKQITGHDITIPANSGANLTLYTMLLMTLTLFPLIMLPDLSKLSHQNMDLTVFTVLGPYHMHLKNALHSPTIQKTQPFFMFLPRIQSPWISIQ